MLKGDFTLSGAGAGEDDGQGEYGSIPASASLFNIFNIGFKGCFNAIASSPTVHSLIRPADSSKASLSNITAGHRQNEGLTFSTSNSNLFILSIDCGFFKGSKETDDAGDGSPSMLLFESDWGEPWILGGDS